MTFQAMPQRNTSVSAYPQDLETTQAAYVCEEDQMQEVALCGIHPLMLLAVILVSLAMWAGIFYVASLLFNLLGG